MKIKKKFTTSFVSILCLLMLTMLCSCSLLGIDNGNDTTEIIDPNQTEVFVYNERMSISLPGDFYAADLANDTFTNGKYLIRFSSTPKANITPKEGYSFPTLREYYEYSPIFKDEFVFYTENGLLCADYNTTPTNIAHVFSLGGDSGTQLLVFFETEDRFYVVSFYAAGIDYATVKAQALEWAGTIEAEEDFVEQPPNDGSTDTDKTPTNHTHTEEPIEAIAPTCTNIGKTEGRMCSECGEVLSTPIDIPANGHIFIDDCRCVSCGHEAPYTYGLKFEESDNGEYAIIDCEDNSIEYVFIPPTYNGKVVTEIKSGAFAGIKAKNIVIPDGITKIGERAFDNCELEHIYIPQSVTYIDKDAFSNCRNLKAVYINDIAAWCAVRFVAPYSYALELNSNPLLTAGSLYLNGKLVEELVIPEGVTDIGEYAFSGCTSIRNVTIPNSVEHIGAAAFACCSNLNSIKLPNGIEAIEYCTFYSCTSLAEITIPGSVKSLGSFTFSDCHSLTSIDIPDGVTSCGENVFSQCYALEDVTLSDSLTEIPWAMFLNCRSLRSIVLPDGIRYIGTMAFGGCNELSIVTIPESVKTIGMTAFASCEKLEEVVIMGASNICESAFEKCQSLVKVSLPKSLEKIEKYAFKNCGADIVFYYGGTEVEWEAIEKNSWIMGGKPFTVECTDKTIYN